MEGSDTLFGGAKKYFDLAEKRLAEERLAAERASAKAKEKTAKPAKLSVFSETNTTAVAEDLAKLFEMPSTMNQEFAKVCPFSLSAIVVTYIRTRTWRARHTLFFKHL